MERSKVRVIWSLSELHLQSVFFRQARFSPRGRPEVTGLLLPSEPFEIGLTCCYMAKEHVFVSVLGCVSMAVDELK